MAENQENKLASAIGDNIPLVGLAISSVVAGWASINHSFNKLLADTGLFKGIDEDRVRKFSALKDDAAKVGTAFLEESHRINKDYNIAKQKLIEKTTGVKNFWGKARALDTPQLAQGIGAFAVVAAITVGAAIKMHQGKKAAEEQTRRDRKQDEMIAALGR
jgi:hypothetical protein